MKINCYFQNLANVGLKRPAEDEEQQDGPGGSKRILAEDQSRPPLSRGDSLPTVPFGAERQPNFKDKHPIRAPSFDTATFKAGSKYNHFNTTITCTRRVVLLIGFDFHFHFIDFMHT